MAQVEQKEIVPLAAVEAEKLLMPVEPSPVIQRIKDEIMKKEKDLAELKYETMLLVDTGAYTHCAPK